MERKLSELFGRKESFVTGQKKNVVRYTPGSDSAPSSPKGSNLKVLSPRNGGGSGLGFSLFRKFSSTSSATKQKNERQFDMGIDPQQHLDDTSDVTKSIKVNLDLQKLQEIADNELNEYDEVDVSELEDKFGVKLADAAELVKFHSRTQSNITDRGVMQRKASDINLSSPRPLRERIRLFYEKHDKTKLAKGGLDTIVQFAAANGVDALNEQLKSKYGETLDDVAPIQPLSPTLPETSNTAPASPLPQEPSEIPPPPGLERKNTNNAPILPPRELFRGDSFVNDKPSSNTSVTTSDTSSAPPMDSIDLSEVSDFDGPVSKYSADSEEYKTMKSRMIDYFIAYDAHQASSEQLPKAIHWALNHNETQLDTVLKKKYGKGILEFEAYQKVKDFMAQAGIHVDEHGPCNDFQLDTTKAFGTCRCGFQKSDHKNQAALGSPKIEAKSKASIHSPSQSNAKKQLDIKVEAAPKPVSRARSLLRSIKIPKMTNTAQHQLQKSQQQAGLISPINRKMETGKISSPSVTAIKKVEASKDQAPKSPETAKNGKALEACSNYRLDMNGSTFGVCVCGHPKLEHKVAADKGKGASELERKLAARHGQ